MLINSCAAAYGALRRWFREKPTNLIVILSRNENKALSNEFIAAKCCANFSRSERKVSSLLKQIENLEFNFEMVFNGLRFLGDAYNIEFYANSEQFLVNYYSKEQKSST